ncbi:MAG: hypothetical protein DWQ05_11795 [Calditrichaeota bacterium]|nr:MAG: hypothetical protein DWQ05_11795 [Calditrichota bacterium]
MKKYCIFILLFITTPLLQAQKVSTYSDSLEIQAATIDSSVAGPKREPFVWQKFEKPQQPALYVINRETIKSALFEDSGELLGQQPFFQVWRDGDSGLLSYASINSAPARFTEITIDGIPIPTGIWGQSDLTLLPETTLENISINPWTSSVLFQTDNQAPRRPLTFFEFVIGPYGSDAVRLRFKRTINPKWRVNLGASFANSDGQWFTAGYGPFDANRVHGIVAYKFKPDLEIRYRLLQSVNDATQSHPFFIDEYPQILGSRRDQRRFMNSMEMARIVQNADTTQHIKSFDKWNFRLYNWHLQEQYSGGAFIKRYIKPQSDYYGFSGYYRQYWRGIALKYQARLETRQLKNSFFPELDNWQEADFNIEAQHRMGSKFNIAHQAQLRYHGQFATKPGWSSAVSYKLSKSSKLSVAGSTKPVFPQPGEFAHTIDTVLSANADLENMQLSQLGVSFDYQKENFHFMLSGGQAFIQRPFELTLKDSLFRIENDADDVSYPFLSLATELRLFADIELKLSGNARFSTPDSSYLFSEMPSMNGSAEISYSRSLFKGDFLAQVLLRGRYWHDRFHFYDYNRGNFFTIWQGGKASMLDIELRGFFRDAMIFVKYENVTGINDLWRPDVPMRWRTMKWGVSWALWD